ncbi:hypothetical protein K2X85_19210 [bacterium]|jgi:hypothetical protein|nr:hypothetical protein [bacterium]
MTGPVGSRGASPAWAWERVMRTSGPQPFAWQTRFGQQTGRSLLLALLGLFPAWAPAQEEALPPTAPISASPTTPEQALENYYNAPGRASQQLMSEGVAAPPVTGSSTLPLPESWTNSLFDPQPRLELRAEAVWLQPNFDNSYPLARQTQSINQQFRQVDIGVRGEGEPIATPRGTIEYHWNEQGSVEASGFYMDGPQQTNYNLSNADQAYYFDSNASNPLERGFLVNTPPGFPLTATDATLDWSFRTWGTEINLLHHFVSMKGPISDLAIGLGGRFIKIDENVNLNLANEIDSTSAVMGVESRNSAAGPQFVARGRVNGPFKCVRFTAQGKIGLMANGTQYKNTISTAGPAAFIAPSSFSDSQVIFSPLFEGLFGCEIYIWRNFVVFGGYQLLYMDRIDRAGGHFSQDLNQFTQPSKDFGDLFLYGPRLGAQWSF